MTTIDPYQHFPSINDLFLPTTLSWYSSWFPYSQVLEEKPCLPLHPSISHATLPLLGLSNLLQTVVQDFSTSQNGTEKLMA